jgi:hypothetical protein
MKLSGPPSLFLKFLEWFCPKQLHEGIESDLIDQLKSTLNEGVGPRQIPKDDLKLARLDESES